MGAGGLKLVPYSFKDKSFHRIFGEAVPEPILPLGRSIEGVPIIYQGVQNTCVDCSVTWLKQWMEQAHPALSWEWLAAISRTSQEGASPNQVLTPAKHIGIAENRNGLNAALHKIGDSSYARTDRHSIYQALKLGPVLVGLKNYLGVGPHMMVALDVTVDGQLSCINWWEEDQQAKAVIPFDDNIEEVIAVHAPALGDVRLPFWEVLWDKISMFLGL